MDSAVWAGGTEIPEWIDCITPFRPTVYSRGVARSVFDETSACSLQNKAVSFISSTYDSKKDK
jgi:hypothetical protein